MQQYSFDASSLAKYLNNNPKLMLELAIEMKKLSLKEM